MHYFVTGATGFIGRRLVRRLLQHKQSVVYFLVREASAARTEELLKYWGVDRTRAIAVAGDLTEPGLGISKSHVAKLTGTIKHFFHLAAVYDLKADEETQVKVNIEGTRHVVEFANEIRAGCLHHVSSIAAAGLYEGVFREDMFEEAESLDHAYFRTKHDSERIVREATRGPWRVYRPGMVVGDSKTGEMDKIDGPYYFFKLIQRLRQALPPWMPTIGLEGGRINIVPVDFVVDALDHIAHKRGLDRKTFHLTDTEGMRVGQVLNTFAKAAHAPSMSLYVNAALLGFIPRGVKKGLMSLTPVRRIRNAVMKDLGLPDDILTFVNYPTRFDSRETLAALKGTGIEVPPLESYAWPPVGLLGTPSRSGPADRPHAEGPGQGQGGADHRRLVGHRPGHRREGRRGRRYRADRRARRGEARRSARRSSRRDGGKVFTYSADVADPKSCDDLVKAVLEKHGQVDVLVNNAGRSIRRAIESSYDRFHDFERTMQLNYFGSLRLTMGLLPSMAKRRKGHVINISSIGVLTNAPRFSAYVASKAALDAWTRCAASEFADVGIHFTTINMPLVRTPMIAPTKIYQNVPTLSPEEAADLIAQAIVYKPVRIATRLGIFGEVLHALLPRVAQIVMNTTFRMFPDSSAAQGAKGGEQKPQATADQIALSNLMRGIHF